MLSVEFEETAPADVVGQGNEPILGDLASGETRGTVALTLRPFAKLSKKDTTALEKEATRLLVFTDPEAEIRRVSFDEPD